MKIFVGIFYYREPLLSKYTCIYFLISKSDDKNFLFPKMSILLRKILSKVLQIKIFLFVRKLNYVNLNLVKFQLQSVSTQKDIENGISLPIPMEWFLPRLLRIFSLCFLGLLQALVFGQKNLEYLIFFKPSRILYY